MSAASTTQRPTFEQVARQAAAKMLGFLSASSSHGLASVAKPRECALAQSHDGGGEWYAYGMCVFFALLNQAKVYRDKKLLVVIGSLGLGLDANPHFECGDPAYTTAAQFIIGDGRSTDLHMWLEDADGCVYDVLSDEYLAVAFLRHKQTDTLTMNPEAVRGVSKQDLVARGFHHVAAPAQAQQDLWTHLLRVHASPFAQLGIASALPAQLNGKC